MGKRLSIYGRQSVRHGYGFRAAGGADRLEQDSQTTKKKLREI